MNFTTVLELAGKTATGIEVPPDVVAALGTSKRPAVRVTINGYTYRSTVASMDGRFMLPVSADVRTHANISAGDQVTVTLELDTEPRSVTIPDDLQAALAADPNAQQRFARLSYSEQRRHLLAIEAAKTAETRQRRIAKTVSELQS